MISTAEGAEGFWGCNVESIVFVRRKDYRLFRDKTPKNLCYLRYLCISRLRF